MRSEAGAYRLSCDIGGTFTDLYLVNQVTGESDVEKCLTTPLDPSQGVLNGVRMLAERNPGFVAEAECVLHATTLVINALIERKGARTGLVTTKGFRDVLEIAREMRYDLYDISIAFPKPLVPRYLRSEITERMYQNGICAIDLDEAELKEAAAEFERQGVESIAVCFLHSYANPAHEEKARALLEAYAPGVPVSISSDVSREVREYERTSTTVANAYVKPLTTKYTARMIGELRKLGFERQLLIMLSSGGMTSAETAAEFPVRIVESGPAAGAVAAAFMGRAVGYGDLLAFDMGGTTAKGCVIRNGKFDMASTFEAARVHRFKKGSGIPLRIPVLDLIEIGAGGGSIARIDELGLIQVGPESAAAAPGPACYGLGGAKPTVTDANLILGYLNASFFLGGSMTLDEAAARRAIKETIADAQGSSVERAAWSIHEIVTENMAAAIRIHMAEKGVDPARFTLVAFGGGGPVHACSLARRIGAQRILIPPSAGIASAFGLLISPISFDIVRTYRAPIADPDLTQRLSALFEAMAEEGRGFVARAETAGEVNFKRSLDIAYAGQGYSVNVPIEDEGSVPDAAEIRRRFEEAYSALYGRVYADVDIELITLRLVAQSEVPTVNLRKGEQGTSLGDAMKGTRRAYSGVKDGYVQYEVYDRYKLPVGTEIQGPAIIEERESTTIVDIDGTVNIGESGTLLINLPEAP